MFPYEVNFDLSDNIENFVLVKNMSQSDGALYDG